MTSRQANELTKQHELISYMETPRIKETFKIIKECAENGLYSCQLYYDSEIKELLEKLGYTVSDMYCAWNDTHMNVSWE